MALKEKCIMNIKNTFLRNVINTMHFFPLYLFKTFIERGWLKILLPPGRLKVRILLTLAIYEKIKVGLILRNSARFLFYLHKVL